MTPHDPESPKRDEPWERMLRVVAGQADAEEKRRARDLLDAADPDAVAAVAEAEALLEALALSLEPVEPSPRVREALLARVRGQAGPGDAATPPVAATGGGRGAPGGPWKLLAGAAAAAALAAALAWQQARVQDQRAVIASLHERVDAQRRELRSLEVDRVQLASLRSSLTSPGLRLLPLGGAPAAPGAAGRFLWDPAGGRGWFYVEGLPPAGEGRDYQLWYVTAAGEKVSLNVFDTDPQSRTPGTSGTPEAPGTPGSAGFSVPLGGGVAVSVIAVTDEPAGGSPQPTGDFQLVGEAG